MIRLRTIYLITVLFMLSSVTSCSWIYYVPNSQNVPLLKEEKEIAANFNADFCEKSVGVETQWAYAFVDHFAVQANLFGWLGFEGSSGSIAEIAPGFITGLGENFIFETYAGYGRGRTFPAPVDEIYPNSKLNDYNIKFDRYFVQPGIGLSSNNMEVAFSTRFVACDYFGDKPIIAIQEEGQFVNIERMYEFYTLEPAFTFRLGWRHFKFHFQYVLVYPLIEKHRNQIFYEPYNFNVGLHMSTGGHFNKQKRTLEGMEN